jgi:UDP-glucose 4-epimerase
LVLDAALSRRPNVTIFGSDYDTPDGTCIRDYIHVTDLAEAHVLALHSIQGETSSGAYNLGNERGFSVRQVIDAAERVTKKKIPFTLSDRRAGDPSALVSSSLKARDIIGWRPKISELDEIVRSAWAWHQGYRAERGRSQRS